MSSGPDPLSPQERQRLLNEPRPKRRLELLSAKRDAALASGRPEDARHRPVYAVWEITLQCDLACRHCGSRAGHARPDELDTEQCLDVVRQMHELGVLEVTLIGGEAYLRDDWATIARAITDRGMRCTMTTGGRGLDAARVAQAVAAGMSAVSVSVDGLAETHDRLRGVEGSHRAALAAMGRLRAAGLGPFANTQVNRLNMAELPELLTLLIAQGVRNWQMMLTVPMGRAADEPEVLLQPYDLLALFPMLAELKARGARAGLTLQPGNNLGYFGPHEATLRSHQRVKHSSGCGAGRGTLGLEADGTVKGCPSLPTADWAGGNLRDHSLEDIWRRATPLRYTRDRTIDDLWGFCRTCYYAEPCMSGCTWTSHVVFGRPGNNPYCHHRALELSSRGLRERVVPVEMAPGTPFDHGRFALIEEPLATEERLPPCP